MKRRASKDNSGCMATVRPFIIITVWKELQNIFDAYKLGIQYLQERLVTEQQPTGESIYTRVLTRAEHFTFLVSYLLEHVGERISDICSEKKIIFPGYI